MPHTSKVTSTDRFRFFTAVEYWQELLRQIRSTKSGDRLLLMSMSFEPTEPEIAAVIQEVESAAARGVHIRFAIDAHSFLIKNRHTPGPLWARKNIPKRLPVMFSNKLRILERINSYPNCHANIINIPRQRFNLPIAGRSHIKAAIINDRIFLGGCNLQDAKQIDLMVSWESAHDADRLFFILSDILNGRHTSRALAGVDRLLHIADNTAGLIIDSGQRRQSRILTEALELIDAAEEWLVITCQFFPNSITADHLLKAIERGVKVEAIFTHPKHQGVIGGIGQRISILRERTRLPNALFQHALAKTDPMLHAKLIACDKGVMIGSHNYVRAGVILGTAEIALKSEDAALAREAVRILHKGLKTARHL